MAGTKARLVEAVVNKAGVFAVKLGRSEHEIVVMPGYLVGVPMVRESQKKDTQ